MKNAEVVRPPEPGVLHMLRHDKIQREKQDKRQRAKVEESRRRAEPFNSIKGWDKLRGRR